MHLLTKPQFIWLGNEILFPISLQPPLGFWFAKFPSTPLQKSHDSQHHTIPPSINARAQGLYPEVYILYMLSSGTKALPSQDHE